MTATLAPTPVPLLLQMAARHAGPAGGRLCEVLSQDYPAALRRRTAQLLVEADATPEDLQEFLHAAGFTDIDELRSRAGRETDQRITAPDLYFTSREGESAARVSLRQVLSREQHNLAETLEALQARGVLETAAAALLAGRHRWVIGDMKSVGYASLLATDLGASLRDVTLIEPSAAGAITALTDAHPSDTLAAFSFQRYSRLTLQVAEQFKALGATVVAITDDYQSPITPFADHVLSVSTRSDATAHSPTTVAAVGHVLATLAGAGAKGATRRAARRAEVALALHCYQGRGSETDPASIR